jgi:hypothetical protein
MTHPLPEDQIACLRGLEQALRGHGFSTELEVDPFISVHDEERPDRVVRIFIQPHAGDHGRLWFIRNGRPLAEASDVTGTIVAVKGLLAP